MNYTPKLDIVHGFNKIEYNVSELYTKIQQDIVEVDGEQIIKYAIYLNQLQLKTLPDLSNIIVQEYFSCSGNELKTLIGSPRIVKGNFFCSCNNLKDLTCTTKLVEGNFYCMDTEITSLKGVPLILGNFVCNRFTDQNYRDYMLFQSMNPESRDLFENFINTI